jgi:hypothetical protein
VLDVLLDGGVLQFTAAVLPAGGTAEVVVREDEVEVDRACLGRVWGVRADRRAVLDRVAARGDQPLVGLDDAGPAGGARTDLLGCLRVAVVVGVDL